MKTFYQWLTSEENRKRRNDPVGILAWCAFVDKDFAEHTRGKTVLRNYLARSLGDIAECPRPLSAFRRYLRISFWRDGHYEALDRAYEEFRAYRTAELERSRARRNTKR